MKNISLHLTTMTKALATFVVILTGISMTSCAETNPADVEVGPYTVSVIEKNVYHIQDYNSSYPAGMVMGEDGSFVGFNNCSDMYLLVGRKKALLIDLSNNINWADNAAESLRQLVAERTKGKELIVTFTHNHGDHIGMLHAYTEDPSVRFALPETDFSSLISKFPETQCSYINDGHVFDLGGIKVDVIEVAGHTNGSVVFSIQERISCLQETPSAQDREYGSSTKKVSDSMQMPFLILLNGLRTPQTESTPRHSAYMVDTTGRESVFLK